MSARLRRGAIGRLRRVVLAVGLLIALTGLTVLQAGPSKVSSLSNR